MSKFLKICAVILLIFIFLFIILTQTNLITKPLKPRLEKIISQKLDSRVTFSSWEIGFDTRIRLYDVIIKDKQGKTLTIKKVTVRLNALDFLKKKQFITEIILYKPYIRIYRKNGVYYAEGYNFLRKTSPTQPPPVKKISIEKGLINLLVLKNMQIFFKPYNISIDMTKKTFVKGSTVIGLNNMPLSAVVFQYTPVEQKFAAVGKLIGKFKTSYNPSLVKIDISEAKRYIRVKGENFSNEKFEVATIDLEVINDTVMLRKLFLKRADRSFLDMAFLKEDRIDSLYITTLNFPVRNLGYINNAILDFTIDYRERAGRRNIYSKGNIKDLVLFGNEYKSLRIIGKTFRDRGVLRVRDDKAKLKINLSLNVKDIKDYNYEIYFKDAHVPISITKLRTRGEVVGGYGSLKGKVYLSEVECGIAKIATPFIVDITRDTNQISAKLLDKRGRNFGHYQAVGETRALTLEIKDYSVDKYLYINYVKIDAHKELLAGTAQFVLKNTYNVYGSIKKRNSIFNAGFRVADKDKSLSLDLEKISSDTLFIREAIIKTDRGIIKGAANVFKNQKIEVVIKQGRIDAVPLIAQNLQLPYQKNKYILQKAVYLTEDKKISVQDLAFNNTFDLFLADINVDTRNIRIERKNEIVTLVARNLFKFKEISLNYDLLEKQAQGKADDLILLHSVKNSAKIILRDFKGLSGEMDFDISQKLRYHGRFKYSDIEFNVKGVNKQGEIKVQQARHYIGTFLTTVEKKRVFFSGSIDALKLKKNRYNFNVKGWIDNKKIYATFEHNFVNGLKTCDLSMSYEFPKSTLILKTEANTLRGKYDFKKRNIAYLVFSNFNLINVAGFVNRDIHGIVNGEYSPGRLHLKANDLRIVDNRVISAKISYDSPTLKTFMLLDSLGGLVELKKPLVLFSDSATQMVITHFIANNKEYNYIVPLVCREDGQISGDVVELKSGKKMYSVVLDVANREFRLDNSAKTVQISLDYKKPLSYSVRLANFEYENDKLYCSVDMNFSYRNAKGQGTLIISDFRYKPIAGLKFSKIKADMSYENNIFGLRDIVGKAGFLKSFRGDVYVNTRLNNKLEGRLYARNIELGKLDLKNQNFQGRININFFLLNFLPRPEIKFYLDSDKLKYSGFEPQEINAYGTISKDGFVLDKLSLTYDDEVITTYGRIDLLNNEYDINLLTSAFDVQKLFLIFDRTVPLQGRVFTSNLKLKGKNRNFIIHGKIFSQYLQYRGQVMDNVKVKIYADSAKINIRESDFYFKQGLVEAKNMVYDLKKKEFSGRVSINNIKLTERFVVSVRNIDFRGEISEKTYLTINGQNLYVNKKLYPGFYFNTVMDSESLTVLTTYSENEKYITGLGKFYFSKGKVKYGELDLKLSGSEWVNIIYQPEKFMIKGKDLWLGNLVKIAGYNLPVSGRVNFEYFSSKNTGNLNFVVDNGAYKTPNGFFRIVSNDVRFNKEKGYVQFQDFRVWFEDKPVEVTGQLYQRSAKSDLKIIASNLDLDFLRYLGWGDKASGLLNANLNIKGSVEHPVLNGQIDFNANNIRFNDNNISPQLRFKVNIKNNIAEVDGAVFSPKNGKCDVVGKAKIENLKIKDLNINLKSSTDYGFFLDIPGVGEGTPKFDLVLYKLNNQFFVKGDIYLFNTQLTYPFELHSRRRTWISDFLSNLLYDINLISDKNTLYYRDNISAYVDGYLHVKHTQRKKYEVFGDISSHRGEIEIIGRNLKIEQGKLIIGDTIPTLDILATTVIDRYKITIGVKGRVDRLKIVKLESEPALSEQDIYTLFATGKKNEIWSKETLANKLQEGINVLLSLNVSGKIVRPIEKSFRRLTGADVVVISPKIGGFDMLTPGDTFGLTFSRLTPANIFTGSSFKIGKFINKNLYLYYEGRFGTDPLKGLRLQNIFQMEYFISPTESIRYEWLPTEEGTRDFRIKYERRIRW